MPTPTDASPAADNPPNRATGAPLPVAGGADDNADGDADAELRRLAQRRASAKIGFYKHLAVYLGVNALLLVINLATSPETLWFYWPLLGWGIAIAAHAARTYWFGNRPAPTLRQRLEEQELQKLKDGR